MAKAKKKTTASKKAASAKRVMKKSPAKKAVAAKKKSAPAKKAASKAKKPVAKKSPKKMTAVKKSAGSVLPAPPMPSVPWQQFLTPLDDRIVVELASTERRTPGGLFIPETAVDASGNLKGKVLVVGRGHQNKKGRIRAMDVHVGDFVLFSEYAGSKMNLQGKEVLFLRESDILGIVERN